MFAKAVTFILKHATLLQTSNPPKAALTTVNLDYQMQNIDESIQQLQMYLLSNLLALL